MDHIEADVDSLGLVIAVVGNLDRVVFVADDVMRHAVGNVNFVVACVDSSDRVLHCCYNW